MSQPRWSQFWRWQLAFFAAGALALGVQSSLLREFLVLMQGDETALGVGLCAWFIGIAVGAAAMQRCSAVRARLISTGALVCLGVFGFVALLLGRLGRNLFGMDPGALLSLGPALGMAALVLLLPGACVGAAFVGLAAAAKPDWGHVTGAIGHLYVFEAIGSLAAGILTSLVLFVHTAPVTAMAWLVGCSLLAVIPAAVRGLISGWMLLAVVSFLGFVVAVTPLGASMERRSERTRFGAFVKGQRWIASMHTPLQHLAIGGTDPHVLYANGQYVTSFPDPIADEVLAHELMLLAQRPQRVLCLGGVETGLLRFMLWHPVERLDLLQFDADGSRFIAPYLDPADRSALVDPRVHVVSGDARRWLAENGAKYDLVLGLDPDPTTLLLARTTSAEFYRLVRSRLAEDGVFILRFAAGANLQSAETGQLGASLYRTLGSVFANVRATPGPEAFLVAGKHAAATSFDRDLLRLRFEQRGIRSEVFVPELLEELLPPERVASINADLEHARPRAAVAHDDRPITFLHALGLRHRIARSIGATWLHWSARHPRLLALLLLVPSALVLLISSRCRSSTATLLAATHATALTGAVGLVSSLLVYVSFQTRVGALYSELGLLGGIFMLGLALGGLLSVRSQSQQPLLRAQTYGLVIGLFLVVALVALNQRDSPRWEQWMVHGSLLALGGVGTGMVFPAASRDLQASCMDAINATRVSQVAARLEFWDHAGAAVAALVAAVVLIPNLGLVRVAALLVAVQVLGLLSTLISRRLSSKRPG